MWTDTGLDGMDDKDPSIVTAEFPVLTMEGIFEHVCELVEDLSVVSKVILALVDVAFCFVRDEAKFGMTFEEPWLEMSVTDVAEDRKGRRVMRCIFSRATEFSDSLEIPIEVLSTYA
jgi:hypothetical protein